MAGQDTITIYRGEDVTLGFAMTTGEDITGWAITFTITSSIGVLIARAGAVTDGPNGEFDVVLTDDDSDSLRAGTYKYDVWRTDPDTERVMAIGDFVVEDVARNVTA